MRTAMRQLDRSIDAGSNSPPRELLERLADEIDSVVVELKRIVRDLRPTALDQLGLVGALAEFTRKFDGDLEIHLALPADADPLPAAVEVAVYRIVTEAVTNVVRHAIAARCWLTMVTGATVEIDVIDDGIGIGGHVSDGVGLTAMRERADRARRCRPVPAQHSRVAPMSTSSSRRLCREGAPRRDRRRSPDVPDGPRGGDRRDGWHRARRPGRDAGRGRGAGTRAAPDLVLLDVRLADRSGWRSTVGSPTTTRR